MPSHSSPVLVLGASGTTGRRLVEQLHDLEVNVRAASRHPSAEQPERSADAGGEVSPIAFDWSDPSTHDAALAGVQAVYLLPPPTDPDPAATMTPFVHRAVAQGVQRLVLLSSSAIERGGPGVGQVHETVAGSGVEWAVLRPSWFMQNFWNPGHPVGAAVRAGADIVSATGDGRIAFIDGADIAGVAAQVLTGRFVANDELVLTGPEALSYDDVAAQLSRSLGRPVVHRSVSSDEAATAMSAAGVPAPVAEMLAGLDLAIAGGSEDRVTDTVTRVCGRAPRSLSTVLADEPFSEELS